MLNPQRHLVGLLFERQRPLIRHLAERTEARRAHPLVLDCLPLGIDELHLLDDVERLGGFDLRNLHRGRP
jgi:hypothetical protein